jgi:hypothetical protein
MGSKQKQTQMGQKAKFEQKLEDRLSSLSKKGIESPRIDKDTHVKKLRAKIRAINDRLKAIAANEKRTEELAKIKAERAAAPPKDRERGKRKKAKEAPEEGKAKKKKPEKTEKPEKAEMTQVPPKEQEDVKVEKTTEAPEEGKEKKKKKVKETAEAVGEGAAAPDQEKAKKKKKVKGETEEAADKAADKAKENE